jgi:hypothetical protein
MPVARHGMLQQFFFMSASNTSLKEALSRGTDHNNRPGHVESKREIS